MRRLMTTALLLVLVLAASMATRAEQPRTRDSAEAAEAARAIDELWTAFERSYALFEDKRVPWGRVRESYLRRAAETSTESELFDLAAEMLALLNDNHVKLTGWTDIMSTGGSLRGVGGATPDFSAELVREAYLTSPVQERVDGRISFAWLPDSVGYVHVTNMYDVEASAEAFDEALARFGGARGLVLDLRRNLGGLHTVGRALVSRLADRPRRYMTSRLKRGPGPDEFTGPRDWILTPPPEGGFTRPVVALVHDRTFSAGETAVLALRVLPHVVIVGTRTSGSMGQTENDVLSNGWVYRTVMQRIVDPEGRSWEGVGIPPDLRVVNAPAEVEAGRDRALEAALGLLASGGGSVPGDGSTPHVDRSLDAASRAFRLPLADSLGAWIAHRGFAEAMLRFEGAREDTSRWALAEDWEYGNLTTVGRELLESGRAEEAAAVLEEAAAVYPDSYRPHFWLTRAYRELDRPEETEAARRRALDLNPELFAFDRRAAVESRGRVLLSRRFYEWVFEGDFVSEEGVAGAVRRYRDMARREPDRIEVDSLQLLRVGQQLREAGQLRDARAVFRFVAEEFPGWALGYLGLAELARTRGDREEAARAYRRALEIDPEHRAAREGLTAVETGSRE